MLQNKNYSKKKYQFAGETDYGEEARKYMNEWNESKRGKRMLRKSTKNKDDFMNHYNNRKKNINEVQFQEYNPDTFTGFNMNKSNAPVDTSFNDIGGFTRFYPKNPEIPTDAFINENARNKSSVYVHEGIHASRGHKNRLTPEKDQTYLRELYKKYANEGNPKLEGNSAYAVNYKETGDAKKNTNKTYATSPAEAVAQINEVRAQMAKLGIRDIFNKRVRIKDLKNYENAYKNSDNPLSEIEWNYNIHGSGIQRPKRKDYRILRNMFNKVSDNNTNNYNNYAKYGGEITFKNYSKFNK